MIGDVLTLFRTFRSPLRTAATWFVAAALGMALALVPLDALALAAGTGLIVILALAHPVLAVGMAVLSVPVQDLVELPGGLSVTQAVVLLMIGSGLVHTLARGEQGVLPLGMVAAWGTLFCALLLSAGATPYSRVEAVRETLRWVVAAGVWVVAASTITRRWHIVYLLVCLITAPAVCAGIGLVQFVAGDGPPAFRIAPDLPYVRAYGTIGQPNSFAGYLNMAWPLALALAVAGSARAWRIRASHRLTAALVWLPTVAVGGASGVLLAALVASFSRGAWVGAAIGVLGMVLSMGRRALPAVFGLLVAGVAVVATGVLPDALTARLLSIWQSLAWFDAATVAVTPANFAVVERMAHLQAGWEMVRTAPLLGVGPGNYAVAYPSFAIGTWYAGRGHAHNYYLHMAAEAGVIGLLAYLSLIGVVVRQTVYALRHTTDPVLRSTMVGGCGIIAAVAGHNLFENLHVLNFGIQLAVMWAIMGAIAQRPAHVQPSICDISLPVAPDSSAAI